MMIMPHETENKNQGMKLLKKKKGNSEDEK